MTRLAAIAFSLILSNVFVPNEADAQLGALVRAARAAGRAGSSAGRAAGRAGRAATSAGRAGSAVGSTGRVVGRTGRLARGASIGGAGLAIAADARAASLFRVLPDDVGRGAAFVTDDMLGSYRVIAPHHGDDLFGASDIYMDLPIARHPERLPPLEGRNLHVLDAEGTPHAVRVVEREDGLLDYVVEVGESVGETALDLSDFVDLEDAELDVETEEERSVRELQEMLDDLEAQGIDLSEPGAYIPPEEDEGVSWWIWGLGGLVGVFGFLYWLGGKQPHDPYGPSQEELDFPAPDHTPDHTAHSAPGNDVYAESETYEDGNHPYGR